jgi:hypothetical protein
MIDEKKIDEAIDELNIGLSSDYGSVPLMARHMRKTRDFLESAKAEPVTEPKRVTTFSAGKMPALAFQCEAAVWCDNDSGSLCYATSMERAKWIAEKLNTVCQAKADPVPQTDGGKFTKKWRDRLAQSECFMQLTGASEAEWMKAIKEACDLIDFQQKEIVELKTENKKLIDRDKFLTALENSGVDNWEGYDEAIETLNSEG